MEEATPIYIEMFHHRLKVILAIVLFFSVFAFKYTSGTEPSCHQKAPSRMEEPLNLLQEGLTVCFSTRLLSLLVLSGQHA